MDGYWICIFPTEKHDSILMVYIQTTSATLLHLVGDGIYWERSKVGFGPPLPPTTDNNTRLQAAQLLQKDSILASIAQADRCHGLKDIIDLSIFTISMNTENNWGNQKITEHTWDRISRQHSFVDVANIKDLELDANGRPQGMWIEDPHPNKTNQYTLSVAFDVSTPVAQ